VGFFSLASPMTGELGKVFPIPYSRICSFLLTKKNATTVLWGYISFSIFTCCYIVFNFFMWLRVY
jgi:hypothetical protein